MTLAARKRARSPTTLGARTLGDQVVKEDRRARVELVAAGRVLRKTYYVRNPKLLRSFLRRSRAQREYENLAELERAGIRCVPLLAWSERRVLGCAWSSCLETERVPSFDLQGLLLATVGNNGSSATSESGPRRELAAAKGRLLRELHLAGFCSTTMSPRNVLVVAGRELVLCDQPHLVRKPASIHASSSALVDVFDAFFSKRRRREWTPRERWLGLLAYCDDNAELARGLWRRLRRRTRWHQRFSKAWVRSCGHLRGASRRA